MDDRSFHKILDHFNLSQKGYRKVRKGVKKRIRQHMLTLGCVTVEEYINALSLNADNKAACRLHLTVSISRFFRDKRLWELLENQFLPRLLSKNESRLQVWSCGCARGEEAYSLKIVWDRLRHSYPNLPMLKLWATDINPNYIDAAKKGIYGHSSLKELTQSCIDRYFEKVAGKQRYILKPFLKIGIKFELNDIVKDDPPASHFDMIFIRNNLLTYYQSPEKEDALKKVLSVLTPGGILLTGSHEKQPLEQISTGSWSTACRLTGNTVMVKPNW
jgi:chemotaxis methyl-accepting protein methylase